MLHTVNKSPYEKTSFDTCLRLARDGSDILLIEDGVYAAIAGGACAELARQALARHRLYALGPDLEARGIEAAEVLAGVQVIDYDGFVQLAVDNDCVQSWL